MKTALALVTMLLAGCAAQPQHTMAQLDTNDARYSTDECRQARQIALTYDDNVGSRMGVGLGLGFLLGPFGIPLAMALDASQSDKREAINNELARQCGATLQPIVKARPASGNTSTACSQGVPGAC